MVKSFFRTSAMLLLLSGSALAQSWTVDSDSSRLSYGTIKKNTVGEVNSFEKLSGTVSENGKLQLAIDLDQLKPTSISATSVCVRSCFKALVRLI